MSLVVEATKEKRKISEMHKHVGEKYQSKSVQEI